MLRILSHTSQPWTGQGMLLMSCLSALRLWRSRQRSVFNSGWCCTELICSFKVLLHYPLLLKEQVTAVIRKAFQIHLLRQLYTSWTGHPFSQLPLIHLNTSHLDFVNAFFKGVAFENHLESVISPESRLMWHLCFLSCNGYLCAIWDVDGDL